MIVNNYNSEKYLIVDIYLKLNINFNSVNQTRVKEALIRGIETATLNPKYKNWDYYIEVEKGSTIGKVLVYAGLLYVGIGEYGDFRQGITQLKQDSDWISEIVIGIAKQDNKEINDKTIIKQETHAGLVDEIKNVIDKIDSLKANISKKSPNQVKEELIGLSQRLSNILGTINIKERESLLNVLPSEIKNSLPEPNKKEMNEIYKTYFIKPDETKLKRKRSSH